MEYLNGEVLRIHLILKFLYFPEGVVAGAVTRLRGLREHLVCVQVSCVKERIKSELYQKKSFGIKVRREKRQDDSWAINDPKLPLLPVRARQEYRANLRTSRYSLPLQLKHNSSGIGCRYMIRPSRIRPTA